MSKGHVKFFNETKGFGFIVEEDTNKEYFVHVTGLVDKIKENDEVEFELQEGRKGLSVSKFPPHKAGIFVYRYLLNLTTQTKLCAPYS